MHINDLYEQQAKDLLNKLCDALGIAEEDRTRANVEAAIRETIREAKELRAFVRELRIRDN